MAFIEAKIFSESLGMGTEVNVIIPQRSTNGEIGTDTRAEIGKYKCLYLLHGLSDDQTIWMRRTSIERYASAHGIAVVMPRGERSFYTDMKYGGKYYTYISEELPAIMEDLFPISPLRTNRYIGGLSMGGYGALKIGLRNSDRYSGIISLSAVTDICSCRDRFLSTFIPIFGDEASIPREDDIFELVSDNQGISVPIFMAVGYNDFLYEDNRRLREHLISHGYDLTYLEGEGIHSWDFWDEYIAKGLDWAFKK